MPTIEDPEIMRGVELNVIDQSNPEINNEQELQGNLLFPGILTTESQEIQNFLAKIAAPDLSDPILTQNLTTDDRKIIQQLQKDHSTGWLDLVEKPQKFFGNAAHKFFTDPNCSTRIYWAFRHEQIQQITGNVDNELGILKRLGIELKEQINKEQLNQELAENLKKDLKERLNNDLKKKNESDSNNSKLAEEYQKLNNELDGKNIKDIMPYINSSDILKGLFDPKELSNLTSEIQNLNNQDENDPEAIYDFIHSSKILGNFINKQKLSDFKENITKKLNEIKTTFNLGNKYPTLPDLVKYFEEVRNMYKGVSINRVITDPPDSLNESFEIKCMPDPPNTAQTDAKQPDPITLITISYEPKIKPEDKDKEGNKPPQTLKLTIAADLKENEMNKALLIMNDQAARYQELSRNNKVEIFGFTKNPKRALELYELIIKSGRVPTIKKETLEAWEAAAADENNPKKEKFTKALEKYKELNGELKPDENNGLKGRLQEIRKKLLEEQAKLEKEKLSKEPKEKREKLLGEQVQSPQEKPQSVKNESANNSNGQSSSRADTPNPGTPRPGTPVATITPTTNAPVTKSTKNPSSK